MIFIFYRTYIDKNLISNDTKFIEKYKKEFNKIIDIKDNSYIEPFDLQEYRIDFFLQNTHYFFVLEGLIIIYRRINIKKHLSN